ncbi:MAG TPA: 50S ribosomal protein L34e [archaeon]|jgi:large subunit ribosomal protein L34e|nr:50S ribosomal protein L34e [archaeon]
MPNPNQKFKKHKSTITPGKRNSRVIVKKKTSNHKCAVCKSTLHGMPHGKRTFEVKKLSKTERRPENLLSSVLCPKCRQIAYQEAVMLKNNIKQEKDLDLRYLKYIKMIMKKIE